ncbi:AzlD domain-containing protein [Sporolactobacillus spathodeae]|uniref:Branched-subunit amino acid transport protein n=1 Tax=Sporolactobacillus spathodeae TaxID=1465502 RepID=A0ABS2Q913_9BACL|nr:AzlD domain-containing protein [Sporolactobacillus spathodeae]MBM7657669.1 branched-subunit amino acid transport protein [Sporolactobacillus spathodeae]
MLKNWLLIGILAVSTYFSRLAGLEFMANRKTGPMLALYFTYVPVAIIAALLVKQIFVPVHGELTISFPILIGCLFAGLSMHFLKRFLPSIIIGMVLGLAARYLLLS